LQAAKKISRKSHFGSVLSSDSFYGNLDNLVQWSKIGVLSVEMETSVIYSIVAMKKLKAGAILAVDGNPLLGSGKGEFEPGEKKGEMDTIVKKAIEDEAKVAIDAIMIMENRLI
jgi:uridine phosphorylase